MIEKTPSEVFAEILPVYKKIQNEIVSSIVILSNFLQTQISNQGENKTFDRIEHQAIVVVDSLLKSERLFEAEQTINLIDSTFGLENAARFLRGLIDLGSQKNLEALQFLSEELKAKFEAIVEEEKQLARFKQPVSSGAPTKPKAALPKIGALKKVAKTENNES